MKKFRPTKISPYTLGISLGLFRIYILIKNDLEKLFYRVYI